MGIGGLSSFISLELLYLRPINPAAKPTDS